MEMSVLCFFLWSASYLKLELRQLSRKITIPVINSRFEAPTSSVLCWIEGLLLGHMGTIIIIVVVFVHHLF